VFFWFAGVSSSIRILTSLTKETPLFGAGACIDNVREQWAFCESLQTVRSTDLTGNWKHNVQDVKNRDVNFCSFRSKHISLSDQPSYAI
jgi:hypothetical protein